jgi:hypothetical protein
MIGLLGDLGSAFGILALFSALGWVLRKAWIGTRKEMEADIYKDLNLALEKRVAALEKDVRELHQQVIDLTQKNGELTHLNAIYQKYLANYIPDIEHRVTAEAIR